MWLISCFKFMVVLKHIHYFWGRFHELRLFVADLKLIHNFCGWFHALRLCLWQIKSSFIILWQILCIIFYALIDSFPENWQISSLKWQFFPIIGRFLPRNFKSESGRSGVSGKLTQIWSGRNPVLSINHK